MVETGKTKKVIFLFKILKLSSNTKLDQYSDLWNLVINLFTVNILKVSLKIRKKSLQAKSIYVDFTILFVFQVLGLFIGKFLFKFAEHNDTDT